MGLFSSVLIFHSKVRPLAQDPSHNRMCDVKKEQHVSDGSSSVFTLPMITIVNQTLL